MRYIVSLLAVLSLNTFAYDDEFIKTSIDESEINCLAQNIYHEARNQEFVGQIAVAFVTLNRVNDWRYPDTFCGVVKDGYNPPRTDCQFSWYCDGKPDTIHEMRAWEYAQVVAKQVAYDHDYIIDPTNGSTHYHTLWVNPWWASHLSYIGVIGDHIFYVEGDPRE